MSKSQGNTILPSEVIEKYSADVLRYYMIGGANPGLDINYNFDDMKVKNRNLGILWNLHNYLIDICKTYELNPVKCSLSELKTEERLMLSKLHSSIKKCTESFEDYKINEVPLIVEDLFLELSRGYIQKVRDKISSGRKEERMTVVRVMYDVLVEVLKMLTPVAPFISEKIYLNMKEAFNLEKESISLYKWPLYDEKMIDSDLEEKFSILDDLTQAVLYAREKVQLGVRWPVDEVIIETDDEKVKSALEELGELMKTQVNTRKIKLVEDMGFKKIVKPDFKALNNEFGGLAPKLIAKLVTESASLDKKLESGEVIVKIDGAEIKLNKNHFVVDKEVPEKYSSTEFKKGNVYVDRELDENLEAEGYTREVMRRVQTARKEAGMEKRDVINLFINCSEEMKGYLEKNIDSLKDKVGASSINFSEEDLETKFKIKDEELSIKLERV